MHTQLKKYYDAFKICNDTHNLGDLTPFVYMFVYILAKSMEQLYEALESRLSLLFRYYSRITVLPHGTTTKYNDLYELLIKASLFSENGINIKDLTNHLNISRDTLNKRLEKYNLIVKKFMEKFIIIV